MTARLLLAGALGGVTLVGMKTAYACHHYSHWAYKTPQRCGGTAVAYRAPEDKRWYVQIAPLKPDPEPQPAKPPVVSPPPPQAPVVGPPTEIDPERAMALEALKAMLAK